MRHKVLVVKFIFVGGLAFIINYLLLGIFTRELHLQKIIAEVIAIALTMQLTFVLHDRWTYSENGSDTYRLKLSKRYTSYILANSSGALITALLFAFFAHYTQNLIALGLAAAISMCWNFFMNLFVWKKRKDVKHKDDIDDVLEKLS